MRAEQLEAAVDAAAAAEAATAAAVVVAAAVAAAGAAGVARSNHLQCNKVLLAMVCGPLFQ